MAHRKPSAYYYSQVAALKQYKKKYNRFPKKKESLGTWCTTQKYYYNKGILSDEKIELLKPTGLLQSGEHYFCIKADYLWDFYQKYGRVPFRDEIIGDTKVGEMWYRFQKQVEEQDTSEGNLAYVKEHYPILCKFSLERKLNRYYSWLYLVDLYQKETGKTIPKANEKYMGKGIGWWCYNQRKLARKKALTERQIELLTERGLLPEAKVCD